MAKKTVIRRMAKRLPSSADVDQVFESDNEASGFTQIERKEPVNITPPPEEQAAPLTRLKGSIASRASEVIDASTGEIEEDTNVAATDTQGTV
jgi:recombinational DNA repair protein RecT